MADITLDTLTLPDELRWSDEYDWSDLNSGVRYTLGGKLIQQSSSVQGSKGRPITLMSANESGWITKDDLDILHGWSQVIDKQLSLTLHNSDIYIVAFRLWEKPVISVEPVVDQAFPDGDTWYKINELRLAVI